MYDDIHIYTTDVVSTLVRARSKTQWFILLVTNNTLARIQENLTREECLDLWRREKKGKIGAQIPELSAEISPRASDNKCVTITARIAKHTGPALSRPVDLREVCVDKNTTRHR